MVSGANRLFYDIKTGMLGLKTVELPTAATTKKLCLQFVFTFVTFLIFWYIVISFTAEYTFHCHSPVSPPLVFLLIVSCKMRLLFTALA
jgi:hypothetical protein